jgi:hypothetical protein
MVRLARVRKNNRQAKESERERREEERELADPFILKVTR